MFPFLLVDRVIEYNPGVSAVAIKNVTINDNFFPGHFPERPIMPGVLMIEVPLILMLSYVLSLQYIFRLIIVYLRIKPARVRKMHGRIRSFEKINVELSYNYCHLFFVPNL